MSRSWRNSWGPELKARDSRVEGKHDWKRQALKELEEVADVDIRTVYIIVNEWAPDDNDETFTEVTGARFFLTEEDAWDHLNVIADSLDVTLHPDDTSFEVPTEHKLGLTNDEYRIEELNRV